MFLEKVTIFGIVQADMWVNRSNRPPCLAFFTSPEKAKDHSSYIPRSEVIQVPVWRDSAGQYYEFDPKPVYVDLPTREEVLNKLTRNDLHVLGLD